MYKKYQTLFSKLMKENYLRKITRNSSIESTFFYKENLPYKSRFSNRKILHDKTSKKMNICSEGPFTPFPLLEFIYVFQFSKVYCIPAKLCEEKDKYTCPSFRMCL